MAVDSETYNGMCQRYEEKLHALTVEIRQKDNELQERRDQVDEYQQLLDEIIVALGSLGIRDHQIVPRIKALIEDRDHVSQLLLDAANIWTAGLEQECRDGQQEKELAAWKQAAGAAVSDNRTPEQVAEDFHMELEPDEPEHIRKLFDSAMDSQEPATNPWDRIDQLEGKLERLKDVYEAEIGRLASLLKELGYCPVHGRVEPCETCNFNVTSEFTAATSQEQK